MGRRAAADRRRAGAEPRGRLVRFDAADGVALAGLLFEPERSTPRAAIWLHGTGGASVFESRRTNLLAPQFTARGIAFFPFNNRGAHIIRRAGRRLGGSAFERIRDCALDVDAAVRELRRRGYRELFLLGHSTGANKVAVYDSLRPRNRIKKYVLLAGGDDTGLLVDQLGLRRYRAALALAKTLRRSDEFIPRALSELPMSWRAWYDVANPDGDYNVFPFREAIVGPRQSRRPLFRHVRRIRKPALYVYGDRDEYLPPDAQTCAAVLAAHLPPRSELVVLEDADHGFAGREEEVGRVVGEWLAAAPRGVILRRGDAEGSPARK
jgi:pimeloyl-ACP methyl ester carboxylesterase